MNTLSNEEIKSLRAKFEEWREFYEDPTDASFSMYSNAITAIDELLARREAAEKPVAIVEHSDYITAAQMAGDEPRRKAVKELYEGALVVGNHLFTAPPLPVVPDEITPDAQAAGKAALLKLLKEPHSIQLSGYSEEMLDTVNSLAIPDGWALVPIEATMDMLKEGAKQNMKNESFQSVWKAMIAAAPKPE